MGVAEIIVSLFSVAVAVGGDLTSIPASEMMDQIRLSDRNETANILADIFLGAPVSNEASSFPDAIESLIYSRFEIFSGPCFPARDGFCPRKSGFYETASKHSVVREGFRLQACGKLASESENVRRALSQVKLQPSDDLSAENLLKAYRIFYPGRKVSEGELRHTIGLMSKLQRSEGAEKAWQKYLALVCGSVGWQIY